MQYSNGRTWPYHGMSPCAMKLSTSVLNKFLAKSHIWQKTAAEVTCHCIWGGRLRRCQKQPFPTLWRWWTRLKVGKNGIVPRRVHVDIHQGCLVRRTQERPTIGLAIFFRSDHGRCELGDWRLSVGSRMDHETKVTMKENHILEELHYDIEVPCPLQWCLLWFPAPTNLNRKVVNNGIKVAKFRDTVNSAIELTCDIAFHGAHTSRACSVRADAPDRDWNFEEEMQGWAWEKIDSQDSPPYAVA